MKRRKIKAKQKEVKHKPSGPVRIKKKETQFDGTRTNGPGWAGKGRERQGRNK